MLLSFWASEVIERQKGMTAGHQYLLRAKTPLRIWHMRNRLLPAGIAFGAFAPSSWLIMSEKIGTE
jgi:hypothetical protein